MSGIAFDYRALLHFIYLLKYSFLFHRLTIIFSCVFPPLPPPPLPVQVSWYALGLLTLCFVSFFFFFFWLCFCFSNWQIFAVSQKMYFSFI